MSTISSQKEFVDEPRKKPDIVEDEELLVEVASQWQLIWWKFRKHKLAMLGASVVILYYLIAIFADIVAPAQTNSYIAEYAYAPPQVVQFMRDGQFAPYVYGYKFERDPVSFKKTWVLDEEKIIPIGLLVHGDPYKLWGIFEMDLHLFGPIDAGEPFYLAGADISGRDVFSRTIFSSRISLSIGLVGVFLTMAVGILLGGVSGLLGGVWDNIIQRLIEIMMSIPMLPIIIAVASMVPIEWPVTTVYFIITLLFAITGWTGLARVVRSKFLALREEDFVLAARLDGAPNRRLILRHMLPSFYSHIIASLTLAVPGMIIGETALSFLGVGLRPPAVSWGVQLQDAQKVSALASHPWLMFPALAVIVVVLAFNFLGDGLRDAADPY